MAGETMFDPRIIPWAELILIGALAWIAYNDLLRFRIPNVAVLVLALGFVIACLVKGRVDLLVAHGIYALAAFILLIGAFARGVIGGGDAKLLAVALLWIGLEDSLVFALLLLASVLIYAAGARFRILPARRNGSRMRIPFAPCIAAAWLGLIALTRLAAR